MYIKLHSTKTDGGNKGSCTALITYLEKENADLEIGKQQHFFSYSSDNVMAEKAVADINGNWRGLKQDDAKFFMITINPSEKELQFISGNDGKLRDYTREVMKEYARGFNRIIDGRPLDGSDLIYFAKIEKNRRYDFYDEKYSKEYKVNFEIRNEIGLIQKSDSHSMSSERISELERNYVTDGNGTVILPGNVKPGLNRHVHVVVARKDRSQRVSLSPFSNSKGTQIELNGRKVQVGFNRKQFEMKCENVFDTRFNYSRKIDEGFQFRLDKSKGNGNYIRALVNLPRNENELARKIVLDIIDKDKKLRRLFNPIARMPAGIEQMHSRALNKAIEKIADLLIGGANPATASFKAIVSRTLSMAISSGLGI